MNKGAVMRRLAVFILLASIVFAAGGGVCSALEVKRRVLPNGLVVLHAERHNLPLVMVTLLVRAGSVDEPSGKAGLANLAAALLTEGTEGRTSTQISRETEFIGATLDASAGEDYSTVSLAVLKKDVATGFDLFSDVLLRPTFPPDEIERKKDLIKGGLRQREEDPSFLASRAFRRAVFGEHPYGRLLEGAPETIDSVTREDLTSYYSGYFAPNNAILAVVGDLDADELDGLIKEYLGGWKEKPVQRPPRLPLRSPPGKEAILLDKDLTQANILLGHLGVRRGSPDYYALLVMNYILGGGGFSSRLMDSIRDEMGLAYSVYSYFLPLYESGMFQAGVQTKNSSANTVIEEILRQMRRIREEEVSDAELSDAKSYLIGSFPRKIDTMAKIAGFLAQVEFFGLGLDYPDKYPGLIEAVSKEDVLRVARQYLRPEEYVLVVVARQSEAGIRGELTGAEGKE